MQSHTSILKRPHPQILHCCNEKNSWTRCQSRNSRKYYATKIWSYTVILAFSAVPRCQSHQDSFIFRQLSLWLLIFWKMILLTVLSQLAALCTVYRHPHSLSTISNTLVVLKLLFWPRFHDGMHNKHTKA